MHVSTMRPDDADMATWLANSFASPRKRHDAISAIRERFASAQMRFAVYDTRPEQGGRLIGIILVDDSNAVSDALSEYDMGRVLGAIAQRYGTRVGGREPVQPAPYGARGRRDRNPGTPQGPKDFPPRRQLASHQGQTRMALHQAASSAAEPPAEGIPERDEFPYDMGTKAVPGSYARQDGQARSRVRRVRMHGTAERAQQASDRQHMAGKPAPSSDHPRGETAIAPAPLTVAYDPKGKAIHGGDGQVVSPIPASAADRHTSGEEGTPRHRAGRIVVSIIVTIFALAVIAGVSAVGLAFMSPATLSGIPGGTRLLGVLGIDTTNSGDATGNRNHVQIGSDEKATLSVPNGATATQVRQLLYDAGLASAGDSILQTLEERNQLASIQPGTYEFLGSEDADTVISRLVNGQRYPSGYLGVDKGNTLAYIESKVDSGSGFAFTGSDMKAAEDPSLYKGTFTMLAAVPDDLHTVEGFIPEGIYDLTKATDGKSAMEVMLQAGQERFERSRMSAEDWYRNLTIAAMIDKEVIHDDEKPLVSSVIHNRLSQNMKLGIDATVKYATGKDDARVLNSDLEYDSPYNTYKVTGLPLGPICSGISDSAIEAARNPAQTDYVYYVLKDKEGHHFFTNNVQDFENAKQEYLKLFGYSD